MLLKAVDSQLGLTTRLAAGLDDGRQVGKVLHEVIELVQQRVFGLCAGYADCNDAVQLAHHPIHKLVIGRDPLDGLGLASTSLAMSSAEANGFSNCTPSRRAIVFHGDVMNTASSLEEAARALDRRFLVSADALVHLDGLEAYALEDLGLQGARRRRTSMRYSRCGRVARLLQASPRTAAALNPGPSGRDDN